MKTICRALVALSLGLSVHWSIAGSAGVVGLGTVLQDLDPSDGVAPSASASFLNGTTHVLYNLTDLVSPSTLPQFSKAIIAPRVIAIEAGWDFAVPSATATALVTSGVGIASAIMDYWIVLSPFTAATFSALVNVSGNGQAGADVYDSQRTTFLDGFGSFSSSAFSLSWANTSALPAEFNLHLFASTVDHVVVSIPEPETYALMLAGLTITGVALRRRCHQEFFHSTVVHESCQLSTQYVGAITPLAISVLGSAKEALCGNRRVENRNSIAGRVRLRKWRSRRAA